MPAYNAARYIGQAIESVLRQTFSAFELLVIDDGSTDDTALIVKSFDDPRIVLVEQRNLGIAVALNNGLMHSRADYIARFDADDICNEKRLQLQYDFMMKNPQCIVLGSAADYVDVKGNFVFSYQPPAFADQRIKQLPFSICPFIHSGVLYKKQIVLAADGYNIHAHSFEDHFLWLQIMESGEFYNLPDSLIRVRLNPDSLTIDEKWRTKEFVSIKYKALKERKISEQDGERLVRILQKQNRPKIKNGSYYALLSKKYLWNNYQPKMARFNAANALRQDIFDWRSYSIALLSFLPRVFVFRMYILMKRENAHIENKEIISEKPLVEMEIREY